MKTSGNELKKQLLENAINTYKSELEKNHDEETKRIFKLGIETCKEMIKEL